LFLVNQPKKAKENAAIFIIWALSGGEERARNQKTAALYHEPDEGSSIHKGEIVVAIQARRGWTTSDADECVYKNLLI